MSWRHRVMRHREPPGPDYLEIHEVYDGGAYTQNGVRVGGNSIAEIREVLAMMLRALEEPVLDYEAESESTEAGR